MGYCSLKRLHGGGLREGSFTGNPKDDWRAPEREHLSLWELRLGGSLLGIRKDIGRKAQRMDMSVHREL
jgi:hypothetical protein